MNTTRRSPKFTANLSKVAKVRTGATAQKHLNKYANKIKEQIGDKSLSEYSLDISNDENSLVYMVKESENKTLYMSLICCAGVQNDLKKSLLSKFNINLRVKTSDDQEATILVHGKLQKWTPVLKNNWLFRIQNYLYGYEQAELGYYAFDLKTLFGFIDSHAELNNLINEFRNKIKDAYNNSKWKSNRTFAYKFSDNFSSSCFFGFSFALDEFVDRTVMPLLRSLEYNCLVRKFEHEFKFLTLYDEMPKFKIKIDESHQLMTLEHECVYSFGLLSCQRIYESFEKEIRRDDRSLVLMSILKDDQRRVQFVNKQACSHLWKQDILNRIQSFFVHNVGFLSFDVSEQIGKQLISKFSQQDSIKYHFRVVWSSNKYLLCAIGLKEWLYEKLTGVLKSLEEVNSSSSLSLVPDDQASHDFKPQALIRLEVKLENIYNQLTTRFTSAQELVTTLKHFYNELDNQSNNPAIKRYLDIGLSDDQTSIIFEGCQNLIGSFVQFFCKNFAQCDFTGQTTQLEESVFYLKSKFMEYNVLQNFDGKYRIELIGLLKQQFPDKFVSLKLFADRARGFIVRYMGGDFEPLNEYIFGTYFAQFEHQKLPLVMRMKRNVHLQQFKSLIDCSSVMVKIFDSRDKSKPDMLEILGPREDVARAVELVRKNQFVNSATAMASNTDNNQEPMEDGEINIEETQEEFNQNLISSKSLAQSSQLSSSVKLIQIYLKDCFMAYNVLLHFNRVYFNELTEELRRRFTGSFVSLSFFKDNKGRGLRLEYLDSVDAILEYIQKEYMTDFCHKCLILDNSAQYNEIMNKIRFDCAFVKSNEIKCQIDMIGKRKDIEELQNQISLIINPVAREEPSIDMNNNEENVIISVPKFTHQIMTKWYQSGILQQIEIAKILQFKVPDLHIVFSDDRITLAGNKIEDIDSGVELLSSALKAIKVAEMSGVDIRARIEWWNSHNEVLKFKIKQMKLNCVVDTKSMDDRVLIYGLNNISIKKCEEMLNSSYSSRKI